MKSKSVIAAPFIEFTTGPSSAPVHRQLYEGLRKAILKGRLIAGSRLPSTRAMAEQLGVARMTVVNAYEQLLAEGYVEGKVGSGTYVAAALPDEMLRAGDERAQSREISAARRSRPLSRRGQWLSTVTVLPASPASSFGTKEEYEPRAFQIGLPAVDEFPFALWSKLAAARSRRPPRELLVYNDPAGYQPLRETVAAYLNASRGAQCEAGQVIVVAGAQQAFDLAARVLLDPGDVAWVEDPGYPAVRNALLANGATVVPAPVDGEGFDLAGALKRRRRARLVYVTPSSQFPLGVTMSLGRRLALLDWAERSSGWIIEDDYNSEYRYAGRPLACLQGMDRNARVIYVLTFSKTIFPALRLGCVVPPPDLVDAFIAARALADRQSPSIDQATLTDFIAEGHFARHVRRMRALYRERQEVLVEAARRELAGALNLAPAEAGMHLIGWLPEGVSDATASLRAAERGVDAMPLSAFRAEPASAKAAATETTTSAGAIVQGGLALGYAATAPRQIREGVRRLAEALR
jgi:GntR family transcriptional regulator/MocR family aminotransferase